MEDNKKSKCFDMSEMHHAGNAKEISTFRLFQLMKGSYWMIFLAALFSVAIGVALPIFSVVFGSIITVFGDASLPEDVRRWRISAAAIGFLGIGVGGLIAAYCSTLLWITTGERIAKRLRELFLSALLRQEVDFFDQHRSGHLMSQLSIDVALVQSGISEKMGNAFQHGAQVLTGIVVGFIFGWKLTLVMISIAPVIAIFSAMHGRMVALRSVQGQAGLAGANELASEVVSGIRTIFSFNAEERTMLKYAKLLKAAYQQATKKAHVQGVALGGSALFIFCIFSLGFWYGGQLVLAGEMNGGSVLTVFISVIMAAMGAGQLLQILPDLSKSRASGAVLFDIIERESSVISVSVNGAATASISSARGEIKFVSVDFAYPQRPDAPVMKKFSLKIKEGQKVALVGKSGAGKSTAVALLQRFYDPKQGEILLDGTNIKEVDVKWLRNQIGYVSQEPILFSGTVAENIRFGNDSADDAAVEEAARNASAHEFISKLPDGYNTNVGERGLQLSGGQKQRIAIARAILKNPRILLLDEATSALDAESEHLVQDALNRLMKDRTTLVIAHRLTTVRKAHKICVVQKGRIVESGTHEELINKNRVYAKIVQRQLGGLDH